MSSVPHYHRDFESRSVVDLKKTGAAVYMAHPTTSIWCMAHCIDDGPIDIWLPGDPVPSSVIEAAALGYEAHAHNNFFETTVEHYIAVPRHGFPSLAPSQQRCSMVGALAMGLPAALELAGPSVGLEISKDMAGSRVMMQMARPRKVVLAPGYSGIPFDAVRKQEMDADGWEVYESPTGRHIAKVQWWNLPEKLERLISYCKDDVAVERGLTKRLKPLKKSELALWHLDQKINQRGVLADQVLAEAATRVIEEAERRLDARMREITNKAVTACSNRNQVGAFLRDYGLSVDTIKKDAIEELLASDIEGMLRLHDETDSAAAQALDPAERATVIREVLMLRQSAARASVAKIDALIRGASPEDGRAKGLLQFHAASTARWSGRRFQPHNLRRPDEVDVDALIDAILTCDYDYVEFAFGDPLTAVSNILRGLIVAADGHRILAADYSNIEGRVLAWLADEDWKVAAFREFDQGIGPDLYIKSYAETFGVPLFDKKDPRRQIGKVMELASGFGGGHGAYLKFGMTDEKLDALIPIVQAAVSEEEWEAAAEKFNPFMGLSKPRWTALKVIITRWREKHANIRDFWYALEDAAVRAVEHPGEKFYVGRICYFVTGSFLAARLPSGRHMFYAFPEVRMTEAPWDEKDPVWVGCDTEGEASFLYGNKLVEFDDVGKRALVFVPAKKAALTYMTEIDVAKRAKVVKDPRNTPRYARIKTYGGMLAENVTQAVARDVLAAAMPRLEEEGYPIILTVHDEIVCEVPDGHGSLEEMEAIMCDLPPWAAGLPIASEGFEAMRYRK